MHSGLDYLPCLDGDFVVKHLILCIIAKISEIKKNIKKTITIKIVECLFNKYFHLINVLDLVSYNTQQLKIMDAYFHWQLC